MFCLAREWDGVGEVNPVAEVGAVVLGGQTVLMVAEGEVMNRMVRAGVVVLEGRTVQVMVEGELNWVAGAGVVI